MCGGVPRASLRRLRRHERGVVLLDVGAERFECRRVADRHDHRLDQLTPLGIVDADDHHVGDVGMVCQSGFDRFGPDVLAAGDDQVAASPGDVQAPVRQPLAEVARGEPTVCVDRRRAVPVAAQQHRRAQADLAIGSDVDLHAVEWHAVVDDTAARFGHPVGGHTVDGTIGGRAAPAEHDRAEAGRIDAGEGSRHQ